MELTLTIALILLLCVIAWDYYEFGEYLRQWGKARRMRKEEREQELQLLSESLRTMMETHVSAGQMHRDRADEWYRKFSRLQIPDLLPPIDYIKDQIKKRLKLLKKGKPAKLPDPVDWANYVPKGVKPKKQLIVSDH